MFGMTCKHCNMPLDTQFGCVCKPTPPPVRIVDDSEECIKFERNLTWFLIGVLVTLVGFGVFYS